MPYRTNNYKPRLYKSSDKHFTRGIHKHVLVGGSFSSTLRGFWNRIRPLFGKFARTTGQKALHLLKKNGKALLKDTAKNLVNEVGRPIANAIIDKIGSPEKMIDKLVDNPKEALKDMKKMGKEIGAIAKEHATKGGKKVFDDSVANAKKRAKDSGNDVLSNVRELGTDIMSNAKQSIAELDPELRDALNEIRGEASGEGYRKRKSRGKGMRILGKGKKGGKRKQGSGMHIL